MTLDLILILSVIILGFASLYFLLRQLVTQKQEGVEIEDVVNKVFGMSVGKIAQQSKQVLESEKEAIKVDLDNKQKAIEKLVRDLKDDLKTRQDEIRMLEKDRTQKYSELSTQLEQHRELAKELSVSTQQLAKVLSNNQLRGSWGERIIEDLLVSSGMLEGKQYVRQTYLGKSNLKPDITLILPNSRFVSVDVKFPYAEIQKMSTAESKQAREAHLKQFNQDLKLKVNKVAEYIIPEENTLDYAILFVPNEMIFSFINQKFPDIIDQAISKRVMIVSPFTFLIVARTVMESYRNFMLEDRLHEVVNHVGGFVKEWTLFKEQFEKYGRSLDTLKSDYDKLTSTRIRQMEKRVGKIEEAQLGTGEQLKLGE
ncbi:MAG TPA: DNA recombination protein RmuC [Patescibacteria group bacterium]